MGVKGACGECWGGLGILFLFTGLFFFLDTVVPPNPYPTLSHSRIKLFFLWYKDQHLTPFSQWYVDGNQQAAQSSLVIENPQIWKTSSGNPAKIQDIWEIKISNVLNFFLLCSYKFRTFLSCFEGNVLKFPKLFLTDLKQCFLNVFLPNYCTHETP